MMPITFADVGEEYIIQRVSGRPEQKKHLEDMGFIAGHPVTVINTVNGNLILKVKECRVAVSLEMAQKIMI